ncbi:MAG: hypothetical protein K2X81_02525 [Candidatus Obscuribacterales bacterium]|nr:hypothetical protein [Candidatus Obscuribacterales bacterium]
MSELFCYFIGILVAGWTTALIAFPEHVVPELGGKKKRFTARHWGTYQHQHRSQDDSDEAGIEVGIPAKKIRHVVGSQTYSAGRGTGTK